MFSSEQATAEFGGANCRRPAKVQKLMLSVIVVTIATHVIANSQVGVLTADADAYLAVARGEPALDPFAGRVLIPRLAGYLSYIMSISIELSFVWIKCISLCLFVWSALALMDLLGVRSLFAVSILLSTPFLSRTYALTYLPDLEFMALSAAAILWAVRRRVAMAALMVVACCMTRELGALTGLALAAGALAVGDRRLAAAAVLAICAGMVGGALLKGPTLGNMHGIPPLLYFILKVPVNTAANWGGVRFFSSTGLECDPHWIFAPKWLTELLREGFVVGLCRPDVGWICRTVVLSLASFGVLPAFVLAVSRHWDWMKATKQAPWFSAILVYGLLLFGIGTVSGTWIDKLVAPGWTAFVLPAALAVQGLASALGLRGLSFLGFAHLAAGHFALWLVDNVLVSVSGNYWLFAAAWVLSVNVVALWATSTMVSDAGRKDASAR